MSGVWIVSRCLLGEPCRYDGRSKGNDGVLRFLRERGCQVVPVCPEYECGLGCPRPAMRLREVEGTLCLTDVNGVEHYEAMAGCVSEMISRCRDMSPDGFLLKSRSPSCGLGDVQVEGREHPGDGVFASSVRAAFSGVPVLSESMIAGGAEVVSPETLLRRAESCARGLLASSPACHDWDHTLRVVNNARRLMRLTRELEPEQCFDALQVEVSAMLHDIGRPRELADCGKTNHAQYGAELVKEWLPALGVRDESFIAGVSECVRSHRFRKREGSCAPSSFEACLVYDADKLDSIGAIGIGRSFHFAGRVGARVHNRTEEALGGASYGREDSAYREYLVKLRHVSERMLTRAGRVLAKERHEFMVGYFDQLNKECFGED